MTPEADRTPEQHAAAALAAFTDELLDADAVLVAVPLDDVGVSQHVKTWVDLVITDPRGQGGPLLQDQPVVLATVRGGAYGAGTPREGWDHSTAYLLHQASLSAAARPVAACWRRPEVDGPVSRAGPRRTATGPRSW